MGVKYTNNAKTTISSGINNSVTTIPVASSSGFPSLSGSDYFYATLDDATNLEVVKVTAVSGTNWTVVRAQDDTTARAWSSGDDIELRLNAALLTDVVNDAMSDAFTRQAFTGDGSTTAFTLSKAPATENDLIVFIEGVFQTQSAYSVSGTTLTFSAAPANSREIIVYNITAAVNGDSLSQNNFTGDGSDTTFTLGTDPLHENNTMVFLDGVYQHKSTYSVSGTTLTFSTAPASGVAIECITHTQTEVNTPASNSVVTASIVDDNVTQAKIADDAVGADQLAASAVVTASIVDDNVTQAKIADDAVGADQLASSAVVTASIVDDAVTTAKIADDQVTLAKMAGLARGKIIYGDSSGNPAALTVGSAGTVLTSDGTDISWAEEVATNYLPLAGGTMTGDLILNDNVKLEIGSASGGDLQIYHDGSDSYITDTGTGNLLIQYSDLYFSKDAGSTHSVVFRSTGRVGFGTTGPARDMVLVTEGATNGFRIESNDETLMFLGAGASSGTGVDDNWVGQYSQGNLKNVFNANGASYFNGGNVGIGTASPSVPLDILTNLSSDTTTSPDTVLTLATKYASTGANGGAGAGPRLEFQIPDDETNPITGAAIAGLKEDGNDSVANAALAFYISQDDTTLDEAMRIASSGHVGLGTSTTQNYDAGKLSIVNTTTTNTQYIMNTGLADPQSVFGVERSGSSAYKFFNLYSGRRADNGGGDLEFQLRGDGEAYADGSWTGGGADYAEYFEWSDGNASSQDRIGLSVVLDGNKIREATGSDSADNIIGVISGNPAVVGDAAYTRWADKYEKDDYGRYIMETYTAADGRTKDDKGNTLMRRKLNASYNDSLTYVERENRKEWDTVGLMGKLRMKKGQQTGTNWIKMRDVSDSVEEWLVR
tara:strand:+ start:11032 stop:13689 length:2658 start_codon:yes stop_codon:yes gene_type:complete